MSDGRENGNHNIITISHRNEKRLLDDEDCLIYRPPPGAWHVTSVSDLPDRGNSRGRPVIIITPLRTDERRMV